MELKLKALSPRIGRDIPAPRYATDGAAAMDLCACIDQPCTLPPGGRALLPTGVAIALPDASYVALIYARSGLSVKHGELRVGLVNLGDAPYTIQPGDRIAQLMVAPVVRPTLTFVPELDDTARGAGGFGSTGR